MKTFILLLFDRDRHVIDVRALGAEAEAAAVREAHAVARREDDLSSYELWNGGRKIAAFFAKRRDNTSAGQSPRI